MNAKKFQEKVVKLIRKERNPAMLRILIAAAKLAGKRRGK